MDLRDRIGLELPILQVGMGGGVATAELAAAVSRAGGLGTIGILDPGPLAREVARARRMAPRRPIAVNLLVPIMRRAHVEACVASRVDAVVLFFGFNPRAVALLREARILVLHQVGTVEEARRALADGADALIAQGIEAGGHLLGMEPALAFLRRALECADGKPVFLAGGVSGAANVRAAIAAGAAGVACGSRFLLTEECRAHPAYKQRLLGADGTIVTELFGFGWSARHRVVPNAATERWCRRAAAGPSLLRRLNRATGFLGKLVPIRYGQSFVRMQRLALPIYSPHAPLAGADERTIDVAPLYAGESVRAMPRIVAAGEAVRELAAGCHG